jgi:hypothetical protein
MTLECLVMNKCIFIVKFKIKVNESQKKKGLIVILVPLFLLFCKISLILKIDSFCPLNTYLILKYGDTTCFTLTL